MGILGISIIGIIVGFSIFSCDNGSNNTHSHEWSNWTLKTAANCTTAEIQERSCSCGEKQTQNVGNPLAHTFSYGFCSICFNVEMAEIPAGTFKMGSPTTEPNRYSDENYRTAISGNVTLSGFNMAKCAVTQGLWKAVMSGANPSYFSGNNLPVERVSWYDAVEFCNALSIKQGLTAYYNIENTTVTTIETANGYRLPTEAQWEYACRAGKDTAFNWGTNTITSAQANYDASYVDLCNTDAGEFRNTTTPVNTFPANAWGLHDMHGNVWEWCWDWYTESYSDAGGSDNPRGAVSGEGRALRGGSWINDGQFLRSAFRGSCYPSDVDYNLGFRLTRP